jgi:hypothetical protein
LHYPKLLFFHLSERTVATRNSLCRYIAPLSISLYSKAVAVAHRATSTIPPTTFKHRISEIHAISTKQLSEIEASPNGVLVWRQAANLPVRLTGYPETFPTCP